MNDDKCLLKCNGASDCGENLRDDDSVLCLVVGWSDAVCKIQVFRWNRT